MTQAIGWEAGHSIETATRKGRAVQKHCLRCGCGIPTRKTWCGPCYGIRYEEKVAANRRKYAKQSAVGE